MRSLMSGMLRLSRLQHLRESRQLLCLNLLPFYFNLLPFYDKLLPFLLQLLLDQPLNLKPRHQWSRKILLLLILLLLSLVLLLLDGVLIGWSNGVCAAWIFALHVHGLAPNTLVEHRHHYLLIDGHQLATAGAILVRQSFEFLGVSLSGIALLHTFLFVADKV